MDFSPTEITSTYSANIFERTVTNLNYSAVSIFHEVTTICVLSIWLGEVKCVGPCRGLTALTFFLKIGLRFFRFRNLFDYFMQSSLIILCQPWAVLLTDRAMCSACIKRYYSRCVVVDLRKKGYAMGANAGDNAAASPFSQSYGPMEWNQ